MGNRGLSRRDLLLASASGLLLPAVTRAQGAGAAPPKRAFRLAHLTDTHIHDANAAPQGFGVALDHVHAMPDRPEMIITGGDLIYDCLNATPEATQRQFDLFTGVLRDHATIPVRHCLGNHDIFGWGNREAYGGHAKFGTVWACEELELPKPYYSFDHKGWHIVVLQSTHPIEGNGYTAKLDDEQFEWFKGDLEATSKETPVLVVSHIPIIMVCAMFDGNLVKDGNWQIPGSYMHVDAGKIKDLFLAHPNVKLCLSGHEHQIDRVEFNGVTYYCGGAVSAGWWRGDYYECTYGYSVVDLFEDGSFGVAYQPFGWKTTPV